MTTHVQRSSRGVILMKLEFSRQIFEKSPNVKFHENPASGNRLVQCRRADKQTDRQADMTKLTVVSRNFENAPKNCLQVCSFIITFQRHSSQYILIIIRLRIRVELFSDTSCEFWSKG